MKWALGIIAGFIALTAVIMGMAVWGGGITIFGAQLGGEVDRLSLSGREKSKINQAENSLGAQARFEQLYADAQAADARVDVLAAAVKRDPSYTNQTNLTGAIGFCIQTKADYNALARTKTAEQFRSTDLPYQIDDLTIDCKEASA